MLELQQAYRLHTLQAAVHGDRIRRVIPLLRSAGVEPLLGKGWAVAQLYPEPGLRPYGDIDLYVRSEQYPAAVAALRRQHGPGTPVDLHTGFRDLDDRDLEELYCRSRLVSLGGVNVRVLGHEDHLRLLCLHQLRHGACRGLWLCDVAAVLESRPDDFDWDYLLSGNQRRSDWTVSVIGLAHRLLGARLGESPLAERARRLPRWLVSAVLEQWGTVHLWQPSMATYLRHPAGAPEALRQRWSNPIEATIRCHGSFNELPRMPYQLGDALARTVRFALRAPRLLLKPGEPIPMESREGDQTQSQLANTL